MKPLIYFYLPVYNEDETVGVLLYRIKQIMEDVKFDYEIYLTLDGCTDDSAEVVEPYMKKLPLLVTQNEQRQGYARCLNEVIRKVGGSSQNPKRDYFVVLDTDFTADPEIVKEMAPGIERNVVLYLPDRLSPPKSGLGLAKRMADRLAKKIIARRNVEFDEAVDLLTTVRACRVQQLRRNMPRMEALNMLDESVPPAVSGALLYLALQDNSRKTETIELRPRNVARRKSRFSPLRTLLGLWRGDALEKAVEEFEGKRGGGRRDESSRQRDRRSGSGKQQESRGGGKQEGGGKRNDGQGSGDRKSSGSRRSRGGRGRGRSSRSGGGQSGGDKQSGGQSGGGKPGGDKQSSGSGDKQSGGGDKRSSSGKKSSGGGRQSSGGDKQSGGGGDDGGKKSSGGDSGGGQRTGRSGASRRRRRRRR